MRTAESQMTHGRDQHERGDGQRRPHRPPLPSQPEIDDHGRSETEPNVPGQSTRGEGNSQKNTDVAHRSRCLDLTQIRTASISHTR